MHIRCNSSPDTIWSQDTGRLSRRVSRSNHIIGIRWIPSQLDRFVLRRERVREHELPIQYTS